MNSGGVDFGGSYERGNEHWGSIKCGGNSMTS
jgi:hypothetical protein